MELDRTILNLREKTHRTFIKRQRNCYSMSIGQYQYVPECDKANQSTGGLAAMNIAKHGHLRFVQTDVSSEKN